MKPAATFLCLTLASQLTLVGQSAPPPPSTELPEGHEWVYAIRAGHYIDSGQLPKWNRQPDAVIQVVNSPKDPAIRAGELEFEVDMSSPAMHNILLSKGDLEFAMASSSEFEFLEQPRVVFENVAIIDKAPVCSTLIKRVRFKARTMRSGWATIDIWINLYYKGELIGCAFQATGVHMPELHN